MKTQIDYYYRDEKILIEEIQKSVRENVAAEYIRWRKEKNMTQAELAMRAGISRSNISRFESGTYNPSLEMMVKIASALDMNIEINLIK
ncbi:MAG: helix-turn-helix transcriptional regulator [Lachnospiraceae bacterium]|nr:helix-turn-helix transcriptional regulator [Lachnospiraceae bacterium]